MKLIPFLEAAVIHHYWTFLKRKTCWVTFKTVRNSSYLEGSLLIDFLHFKGEIFRGISTRSPLLLSGIAEVGWARATLYQWSITTCTDTQPELRLVLHQPLLKWIKGTIDTLQWKRELVARWAFTVSTERHRGRGSSALSPPVRNGRTLAQSAATQSSIRALVALLSVASYTNETEPLCKSGSFRWDIGLQPRPSGLSWWVGAFSMVRNYPKILYTFF